MARRGSRLGSGHRMPSAGKVASRHCQKDRAERRRYREPRGRRPSRSRRGPAAPPSGGRLSSSHSFSSGRSSLAPDPRWSGRREYTCVVTRASRQAIRTQPDRPEDAAAAAVSGRHQSGRRRRFNRGEFGSGSAAVRPSPWVGGSGSTSSRARLGMSADGSAVAGSGTGSSGSALRLRARSPRRCPLGADTIIRSVQHQHIIVRMAIL